MVALALSIVLVAFAGCDSTSVSAAPTPFPNTTAPNVHAHGNWLNQLPVTLTLYTPAFSPAKLPDKVFQARFAITDADAPFGCLSNASFGVYSAPSSFPKKYVMFAQCVGGAESVWTFPVTIPPLTTVMWPDSPGVLVKHELSPVSIPPNSPIAKLSLEQWPGVSPTGLTYQGLGTDFETNVSAYQCAKLTTPNVYTDEDVFPWTSTQAVFLIHIQCANQGDSPADITWQFSAPIPATGPFIYQAQWHGRHVNLTKAALPPSGIPYQIQTPADSVSAFFTDDPKLQCFNNLPPAVTLNTYLVQGDPVGQYLVYDRCPEFAAASSWTFCSLPAVPHPSPGSCLLPTVTTTH
jgi:hypothetical protein